MGTNKKPIDYLHLPRGTVLKNKYLIKDKLVPQSNLSILYKAINSASKEQVVIKEFFPQGLVLRDLDGKKVVAKNPKGDFLQKEVVLFLQEAKVIQQLQIPQIGRCYDYFKANNTAYIVLKYYQGINLEEYIKKECLKFYQFIDKIFLPLLKTVAHIHKQGYLHRDLKPANIIYNQKVVLIDFGSAIKYKKKENKKRVLTPGYAPLEFHSESTKQGPSSDIYSLAAILYYFLTSQVPLAVKQRIIKDELVPVAELNPWVSQGLNDFIMRNLSLNAKYRDQTILDFRLNLELECFKIKSKKILNSFVSNFFK